jgi:predicted transcriptional regulator
MLKSTLITSSDVALLDDIVIGVAAAVSTTCIVIMFSLLTKYRRLVSDQTKSGELAKSLWESMSARLATQDARIVDLMARFEVYSVRRTATSAPVSAHDPGVKVAVSQELTSQIPTSQVLSQPRVQSGQATRTTNNTEATILRSLLEGPRTSNSIRQVIQVTREHNARLLKGLYNRGLVMRNDQHKPFVYEITEAGKTYLSVS